MSKAARLLEATGILVIAVLGGLGICHLLLSLLVLSGIVGAVR